MEVQITIQVGLKLRRQTMMKTGRFFMNSDRISRLQHAKLINFSSTIRRLTNISSLLFWKQITRPVAEFIVGDFIKKKTDCVRLKISFQKFLLHLMMVLRFLQTLIITMIIELFMLSIRTRQQNGLQADQLQHGFR